MRTLLLTLLALTTTLSAQTRAEKVQVKLAENPKAKWWEVMDTGPFISDTFKDFGTEGKVAALKGIAIKLGKDEDHTIVFDTETMRMAAGFSGNVSLAGTPWDGKHANNSSFPKDKSQYFFVSKRGPGWAVDGNWEDPRELDNGKPNGPLPDAQAEYLGLYQYEGTVILSYTAGGTKILEHSQLVGGVLIRSLQLEKTSKPLQFLVSDPIEAGGEEAKQTAYKITLRAPEGVTLKTLESGRQVVDIPAGIKGFVDIFFAKEGKFLPLIEKVNLNAYTTGGKRIFPETVEVAGRKDETESAYSADSIPLPLDNPWQSEIRFGAFDFFPNGKRAACSTWNGDVWIADGIDGDINKITWSRYASGMYQTLGLKIVDGIVHTMGRDQITRLHDLNNDGEADFYECFNNDVNITEGFHEFAFDLQTDKEGNFYFAKSAPVLSGGRGFAPWTEHNGTVLKLSADGKKLERVAWGLRAPGGVGIGPNGEITTGENEGSYVPRCKITWSKRDFGSKRDSDEISFHGVVPSVWEDKKFIRTLEGTPTDYERPLCWLPYFVDNSSGSQFWVPEDSSWSNHAGNMLHLSYGKSSVYRTLIDEVDGQVQGGVYRLPVDLTTAAMRGRFHPKTGDLYLIGFRGWQTNGGGGFQRIRYNGADKPTPTGLKAHKNGIILEFSAPLDPEVASDPRRYSISKWDYVWGPQYGSGRFSIDNYDDEARQKALGEISKGAQNQVDSVPVRAASLLDDGKTVFLYIPDMTPAMQMEIKMDLTAADKTEFRETIWNTIHNLRPDFSEHGLNLTNLPKINSEPIGDPGLVLSMAHGSTDDAVVVDRMALSLREGEAVSPFISPNRGNEMVFEGALLVGTRDTRTLRLEGVGWASLKLNGNTIMEGELPLESEALALEADSHQLFCNYRRPLEGEGGKTKALAGRIQLLWSGKDFVFEPVRPASYRYLPTDHLEAKTKPRYGRTLFASKNCVACHKSSSKTIDPKISMPELLERAPDFANAGNRYAPAWVEAWTRKPQGDCPNVAPDEAADIAAYLATLKSKALKAPEGDATSGETLAAKLHFAPWAENLKGSGKFTSGGLVAFLKEPAKHHAATTFPDLHLNEKEADDLAAWLQAETKPAAASPGDAQKGRATFTKRCMVCHGDDPKTEYEFSAKPLKEMWEADWMSKGCLSTEEADQPELRLTLEEKQALIAFRNVDAGYGLRSLNRFVLHEYATRTMKKLSCANCHSGENELPDISLAGEKLRDEWLTGLFQGDVLKIRPYQEARMPAFASRAQNLALGLAHRAGVSTGDKRTKPDKLLSEEGAKISGLTGYACITCHAAGEKGAMQAFEGQGPNLQLAGERLRKNFYHSWMHWPQRFVPITIMPKYTADKKTALNPSFYEGDADKQFDALWEWMKTLEGAETAPIGEVH